MTIRGVKIPAFMSLIIWAIAWELIGRTDASFVIPPLSNVVQRVIEIAPTDTFVNALAITGKTYFLGMGIAILIGVRLGVVMGRSDVMDKLFMPWVNIFVSAPLTALVPVIMVLFGFGEKTIVLTVALFAIWIIVLNARAGVREYPVPSWKWPTVSGPRLYSRFSRSISGRRYRKFWGHPAGFYPWGQGCDHWPAAGVNYWFWPTL